ncbi:hypothetical protein SAMN02800692_0681 [Luteibacter sp. UNC138MFCol5.1]|uniref:hypothetical protein n=1 Tax=Luteibacter sp. UNC138MFCol5.1 TaxID=1502774 RepID=UPI0008B9CB91|nr:hypothetical protein [Luteibacter sp. UNC138MFCol5.1]SEO41615.1 hypothetical protein SAMN02800692_0681 [Luteibacter sp. UNC138MFCol5.1]
MSFIPMPRRAYDPARDILVHRGRVVPATSDIASTRIEVHVTRRGQPLAAWGFACDVSETRGSIRRHVHRLDLESLHANLLTRDIVAPDLDAPAFLRYLATGTAAAYRAPGLDRDATECVVTVTCDVLDLCGLPAPHDDEPPGGYVLARAANPGMWWD